MKEWSAMKKLIWMKRAVLSAASAILKTISGLAPLLLENALAHPIHALTQYGKCTQDGTPTPDAPVDIVCNNGVIKFSPNLIDASAGNVTLGYYIEKTTGAIRQAQGNSNFMCKAYMPVIGGQRYVAYGRTKNGGVLSAYNRIAWYDSNKDWISGGDYTQNTVTVNTAPANAAYARFSCNPSGNVTTAVTQELVDSYYWVFQQGDAEPSVVHPYVAPNGGIYADGTPEVLTVIGKNLINPDAAGVVNGSFITNTGNQASDSLSFISDYIPVAEGETYTAQGYRTSGTATANLRVHGFDSAKTWTEMLAKEPMLTDEVTSASFTIPSGVKYVRVCGYIGYRSGKDAMLELGSTATAYEPYTAQTASVENLLAVGNYKDTQEIIDGLLTHKVGAMALDGTEAWQVASTSGCYYAFISTLKYNNPRIAGLSTHFVGSSAANANMPDNAIAYAYSGSNGIIVVKCTACADVTAFRALLSAQYAAGTPVIIIYPLATETTEQTTAQHLHTANGTNIVDVTSNVDPVELKAEYYATE